MRENGVSLSSRRAWIEILTNVILQPKSNSRSPRGERGLKSLLPLVRTVRLAGRSPRGERGLK